MSTSAVRLRVTVDIFDKLAQPARPLTSLTVAAFVAAILTEFQADFSHLGSEPTRYYLARVEQSTGHLTILPGHESLTPLLRDGDHLVFCEKNDDPPTAAAAPRHALYLREQRQNRVFPLQWLPALIGRPYHEQPDLPPPAVDLSAYPTGLRVSRRHAQIVESGGRYYVESLTPTHPLSLRDTAGNNVRVTEQKQLLQDGDTIILENSEIQLQFLVRSSPVSALGTNNLSP